MNSAPVLSQGTAVKLRAADRERLAALCERCTDFFDLVEGQPGGTSTADEILGPLPQRVTSGTKQVFGIERLGELVGVVEILEGFPEPNEWQMGLLLLRPDFRGVGLGASVWLDVRRWISGCDGKLVRLVVQHQNPSARRFWERQGFNLEKEAMVTIGKLASPVWVMVLHLA